MAGSLGPDFGISLINEMPFCVMTGVTFATSAASFRRIGLMSVMTTCRAPTWRATAPAMMPIGPAPVISTSSPTRLKDSAVCVALPNGSKIAASSSGMSAGILKALKAGIARYSAKAPARLTPTPTVLRHRCRRPARQLRQKPQVMWPSPDTRSPISNPLTSLPSSAISPTYSWPTWSGTGSVFCAQSSQFQIWQSVPQIAVFLMRISTSFGPTSGFATSVRVRPGARSSLAMAFIVGFLMILLSNDSKGFAGLDEAGDGAVDVVGRMAGAHLGTDPRLALGHDRIGESYDVNA